MFTTHTPGTQVKTSAGIITIQKEIDSGGSGVSYQALDSNNKLVFYKQYYRYAIPPRNSEETLKLRIARTKDLVKRNLSALDERINAPYAYSEEGGYVCRYLDNLIPLYSDAGGKSFLSNPTTYSQRINVLSQLVDLLEIAHRNGVSHGNLNGGNIQIDLSGALKVYLIDWSNFFAGDPELPPLMAGTECSMSYWTREYGELPDWRSDIYSCALKAYELLLGVPFTDGLDHEQALERLKKCQIPGDSLSGGNDVKNDGLPFQILSPELQSLLRSSLQPEKTMMPSTRDFAGTLRGSLKKLDIKDLQLKLNAYKTLAI